MSSDCARHFSYSCIDSVPTYLGMYVSQQSAVASRYSSDETDGGYSTCIGHMLHTGTYPGRDVAGLSNIPPAATHTQHGEELLHSSSHMI